jgi:hypothetical protein
MPILSALTTAVLGAEKIDWNPGDWVQSVDDKLGHLLNKVDNALDPITLFWNWIRGQFADLWASTATQFQAQVLNPPTPFQGDWQYFLFGNALGLAGTLVNLIAVCMIVVAMFFRKRLANAIEAFAVAILFAIFGPTASSPSSSSSAR